MDIASTVGTMVAIYGVVMACSPLLQLRRMLRTRSSRDVSIPFLTVMAVGYPLWLTYGLLTKNLPIVIPNVAAAMVGFPTLIVAINFRRDEKAEPAV